MFKIIREKKNISDTKQIIDSIAKSSYVNTEELAEIYKNNLLNWVDLASVDTLISEGEEEILLSFMNIFNLDTKDNDIYSAHLQIVKGAVLREICNGHIPERVKISTTLPVVFEKSEKLIWVFEDVQYKTYKTKTHFEGKSSGISVRIAKGIYYRVGKSEGRPIEKTESILIGSGLLSVTNKNIFFINSECSHKIPYKKMTSIYPYNDGIEIQIDSKTIKPHLFIIKDSSFAYNLILNLANLKS